MKDLKVLFYGENAKKYVERSDLYDFLITLSKQCNLSCIGKGWKESSLESGIKEIKPDWILCYFHNLPDLFSVNCRVAVIVEDIHRDRNMMLEYCNKRADLVLYRYPKSYYVERDIVSWLRRRKRSPKELISKRISKRNQYRLPKWLMFKKEQISFIDQLNKRCKTIFFPFSVDEKRFKPLSEKIYDIVFLGAVDKRIYPLRYDIEQNIARLCKKEGWNLVTSKSQGFGGSPAGLTYEYAKKHGGIVGEEYAKVLGQAKIMITGTSIFHYAIRKIKEGMSAGMVVLTDNPQMSKELGLKHDLNYFEINKNTWEPILTNILKDTDRIKRIGENGRELVLRMHTNKIRAMELIKTLEGF